LQGVSLSIALGALLGGYGQFGISNSCRLQTLDLSPTSFRVRSPNAVSIAFAPDSSARGFGAAASYWASFNLNVGRNIPSRVLYELCSLGFSLDCPSSFELRAEGVEPPYLTWNEGSVGEGVPTPVVNWVILSWPTPRPPILLCFDPGGASLTARKTEKGFVIEAKPMFSGRVRIRTPFGTSEIATRNASELGKMVERVRPILPLHTGAAPRIVAIKVSAKGDALTGTITFDKPGAILPQTVYSAAASKQIAILMGETVPADAGGSPMRALSGTSITIKLFARQLRPGASLVSGPNLSPLLPSTISFLDAPSIAQTALAFTAGIADSAALDALTEAERDFKEAFASPKVERISKTPLFFESNGEGAASAAAWGLMQMAFNENPNALISVLSGTDWATMLPPGNSVEQKRDAAALCAIACAYSSSPEDRFIAGLMNAALAGDRASGSSPFYLLRSWLFPSIPLSGTKPPDWFQALISPIGIGAESVGRIAVVQSAGGMQISGTSSSTSVQEHRIFTSEILRLGPSTPTAKCELLKRPGGYALRVSPVRGGPWSVHLNWTKHRAFPKACPSPRYNEAPHSACVQAPAG
jgi:hypothetical protein